MESVFSKLYQPGGKFILWLVQYQTNTKLNNNTSKGNTYSYYDCNIPTNKTNYCPLPHEVDLEYGTELQPFYLLGTEQQISEIHIYL
jgi:hypothetical protein